METNKIVLAVLVLLVVFAAFQEFQISSFKKNTGNTVTGNVVQGQIDMTGWTENEKMEYEHHGTLPARLRGSNVQQQSSQMVGGC